MIVVTGGAGFIGSNIVKGLNDSGRDDIVVVDDLTQAEKHRNLNPLKIADYIDKEAFWGSLESGTMFDTVDAVIHQGACSDTTESDGRYMMQTNYDYSKALLHYALKKKIPFLYASSAAVYGNGENGFRESRECEYPLNVYGFSKFMFDNYVRGVLPKAESQVAGFRYFNVYGYQENHKKRMASTAFHFYHQVKETGVMKLFEGSKEFKRDFVFIEDVVDVNLYFLENPISGIFNCGSGKAESFYTMASTMMEALEAEGTVEFIPFPDDLRGKYQDYTQADITVLRKAGYAKPFHALSEGLRKYAACLEDTGGYLR